MRVGLRAWCVCRGHRPELGLRQLRCERGPRLQNTSSKHINKSHYVLLHVPSRAFGARTLNCRLFLVGSIIFLEPAPCGGWKNHGAPKRTAHSILPTVYKPRLLSNLIPLATQQLANPQSRKGSAPQIAKHALTHFLRTPTRVRKCHPCRGQEPVAHCGAEPIPIPTQRLQG